MVTHSVQYAANNIGISGFKYVLGQEVSKFRRFVWLLVILLASAWMIWNIQGRVSYFLSRTSAITTQTKFKDKIMFPKITICNQNTFRSSQVFNETDKPRTSPTLYEAIDRYLHVLQDDGGHQSSRQNVVHKYEKILSDKNIVSFYSRMAHQKSTLIQRCIWKGQKCGPNNFTELFTNMGVCYQFNPDDLIVDKPNKDGGLNLMLFVEQYDYMRGPQSAAGALVVITHQNETEALAKEQGIGVTVGQSVSIGLQQSEFIDLPHPYGACATTDLENYPPDEPYTYQKCHLNCLTSFIKRKCGCVNIYMPGHDTPCTLLRNLECVTPNEELFYQTEEMKKCNCTSPCNSVSYSSSMSLVQFSNSFTQTLALANSSASLSQINRAIDIQAWGLLNTINPHLTDSLARIGSLYVDFSETWAGYSSALLTIMTEVRYLMRRGSEDDVVDSVMLEIEPEKEASVTFERLQQAVYDIEEAVGSCDLGFPVQLDLKWTEDSDDDLDLLLAENIILGAEFFFELSDVREYFEASVEHLFRDHELFLSFTSVAISKLNSSTLNSSSLTQNTLDLASHMADIYQPFFDEIANFENEYSLETVQKIADKPYYKISSSFYSDNVLKLNIYFKDLGVQEAKKSPTYSAEGLVCDIGGSIGLCLGGSILTLFEFFDIVAILFGRRKKGIGGLPLSEKKAAF